MAIVNSSHSPTGHGLAAASSDRDPHGCATNPWVEAAVSNLLDALRSSDECRAGAAANALFDEGVTQEAFLALWGDQLRTDEQALFHRLE